MPHEAIVFLQLAPAKGGWTLDQAAQAVRKELAPAFPAATFRVRSLAGPNGWRSDGWPVQVFVRGPEAKARAAFAAALLKRLAASGLTADAALDEERREPNVYIDLNRDKLRTLGITLAEVYTTLEISSDALSLRAGTPKRPAIVLRGPGQPTKQIKDLQQLALRTLNGQLVPMGMVATFRETTAPVRLTSLDGEPAVELTADLAPGATSGEVVARCHKIAAELRKEMKLDDDYQVVRMDGR
jgi:multidrug efflux pump subunit AcrB